jgi:hypothetical protein
MEKSVIKEVERIIKERGLNCSVEEFEGKVYWYEISERQVLSEGFIREFEDRVNIELYRAVHKEKSLIEKRKEVKLYAKKHGLKVEGGYLYAYRNHDKLGRGMIMPTRYKKGVYYRDWHCDMKEDEENSFGFGIFPKGNTPVKVKVEDWGVEVDREDGKGRVWGFGVV